MLRIKISLITMGIIFLIGNALAETIDNQLSTKEVMTEVTETYPGILSLDEQVKSLDYTYKSTLYGMLNFNSTYSSGETDTETMGANIETDIDVIAAGASFNLTSFFAAQGLKYTKDSVKEQLNLLKQSKANEILNILEKRGNYLTAILVIKNTNLFLDRILKSIDNSELSKKKKEEAKTRIELSKGSNLVKANQLEQRINALHVSYFLLINRELDDDFKLDMNNASWEGFLKNLMDDKYDSENYGKTLSNKLNNFFLLPDSVEKAYKIALKKGSSIKISNLEIFAAKENRRSISANKLLPTVSLNYTFTDTETLGQDTSEDQVLLNFTWVLGAGSFHEYQASNHTVRSKEYAKREAMRKDLSGLRSIYRQVDSLQKQFAIAIENFRKSLLQFREIVKNDRFNFPDIEKTIEYTSAFVSSVETINEAAVSIVENKTNAHLIMGTFWEEVEKTEGI